MWPSPTWTRTGGGSRSCPPSAAGLGTGRWSGAAGPSPTSTCLGSGSGWCCTFLGAYKSGFGSAFGARPFGHLFWKDTQIMWDIGCHYSQALIPKTRQLKVTVQPSGCTVSLCWSDNLGQFLINTDWFLSIAHLRCRPSPRLTTPPSLDIFGILPVAGRGSPGEAGWQAGIGRSGPLCLAKIMLSVCQSRASCRESLSVPCRTR